MRRFLIAVALCAITAVSGAWTLHWNADSGWPAGTTVTACLNSECIAGITGASQVFSGAYLPGTVLHGTAQAVPPAGYQCGEPPAPCPPSSVAEIAQTIPADQQRPDRSAWVATGGLMAAPTFVAQYATAFNSNTTPKTAMSAVAISSGDVLVIGGAEESADNVSGYAPTFTENGSASLANSTENSSVLYSPVSAATYTASASENITITAVKGTNAATGGYFGANVARFSGSSGVGAIQTGSGSGSPSISITTTQANSAIVVIFADWNATTGTQTFTSNGGAGSPASLTGYAGDGVHYGVAIAYYANAGTAGSKTVGMSAPTGQKWRGIAIEVKGTAASAASAPPDHFSRQLYSMIGR